MHTLAPNKATLVIPLYKPDLGFLIETLRYVVRTQKEYLDKIVLVDDGSPEPLLSHEADFRVIWDRINIIRQLNKGPGGARNGGAVHAHSGLLVFLDQDCRPSEQWLKHLLLPLETGATVAVMGQVSSLLSKSPVAQYAEYIGLLKAPSREADGTFRCLVTANFAIRKDVFDALGGFDERLRVAAEDLDLTYRLVKAGYSSRLAYATDATVAHFQRTHLRDFYRQQYGYAYATMMHCILRNRDPQTLGFRDKTFADVMSSLFSGLKKAVRIMIDARARTYGFLNSMIIFPLLELLRMWARIRGHRAALGTKTGTA